MQHILKYKFHLQIGNGNFGSDKMVNLIGYHDA